MIRTQNCDWYIGRLVKLNRPIKTFNTVGGAIYAPGRVFRISRVSDDGKASLAAPAIGVLMDPLPVLGIGFEAFELVRGFNSGNAAYCRVRENGFCRVCGCIESHGCPPDAHGDSCHWADDEQTLCSRCVEPLLIAARRGDRNPVCFLQRTLSWGYCKSSLFLEKGLQ